MSEIHGNQGPTPPENYNYRQEKVEEHPQGNAFRGETTDLRYDPGELKRTLVNVNKPIRYKIGNQTVEFGRKQINQIQKDMDFLDKNPAAVQKASALFPAFHGYAKEKGYKNPYSLALALEHYAATNEFVKDAEQADQNEN